MPTLRETLDFIIKAHEGQVDKAGRDYWMHPVSVMNRLGRDATQAERQVALLHDVIEDTKTCCADLTGMGFPAEVVDAVEILSHICRVPGRTYMDFIQSIAASGNAIAIKVKIADLQDNMDPERVAAMPLDERGIVERYERALPVLEKAAQNLLPAA